MLNILFSIANKPILQNNTFIRLSNRVKFGLKSLLRAPECKLPMSKKNTKIALDLTLFTFFHMPREDMCLI